LKRAGVLRRGFFTTRVGSGLVVGVVVVGGPISMGLGMEGCSARVSGRGVVVGIGVAAITIRIPEGSCGVGGRRVGSSRAGDGRSVGSSVGVGAGEIPDIGVGTRVDTSRGSAVGGANSRRGGLAVGERAASRRGADVGVALGSLVGADVGIALGAFVGAAVGVNFGAGATCGGAPPPLLDDATLPAADSFAKS
jgi:hypothetical protein